MSVGIAVSFLLAWHIYLVFSAQTTIEFYYNRTRYMAHHCAAMRRRTLTLLAYTRATPGLHGLLACMERFGPTRTTSGAGTWRRQRSSV